MERVIRKVFEDLWIIDKSFRKYLDYFLEDKKSRMKR